VSNLYRIGQQAFISKSIYGISAPDGTKSWNHLFGFGVQPKAAPKSKKSGSKPIDAISRPGKKSGAKGGASKGSTKTPARAGAPKGGRSTGRTTTSSRGTKGGDSPKGSDRAASTPSTRSSDAGDSSASPPLQPRVRKKKR